LCCKSEEAIAIQQRLERFKIFDVSITKDYDVNIEKESSCPVKTIKSTSTFVCTSIIEHKDEVKLIRTYLNDLNVKIERLQPEKVDTLTKTTLSSSAIVATIVFIVLFSYNINNGTNIDLHRTIIIPLLAAGLGALLELLIIYKERNQ
jgi:phosphomevalonate kinase